jgi:hypothetical protein
MGIASPAPGQMLICLDVAVSLRQAEHVDHIFTVEEAWLLRPDVRPALFDGEMVLPCWLEDDQELARYRKPEHGFAGGHAIPTLQSGI